jgi:eukaryotic-like serine/threonine-protein kinase
VGRNRSSAMVRALGTLERTAKDTRARAGRSSTRALLARESGVSEQTLSDWFNGRHHPRNLDQVMKVVQVLTRWAERPPSQHVPWSRLLDADPRPAQPADPAAERLDSTDRTTAPPAPAEPQVTVPRAAGRLSRRRLLAGVAGVTVAAGAVLGTRLLGRETSEPGVLRWKYPTDEAVSSNPVVADGVVYVGSDDRHLYAFATDGGPPLWRVPTGGRVRSGPVVAAGVVYMGSDDKNLYAVEAASGSPRWRQGTGAEPGWSSPALTGGAVFIGSDDGRLHAFDAADGRPRWQLVRKGVIWGPTAGEGIVYFGCETGLYAVAASDREELWHIRTTTTAHRPTVSDGVVYFGDAEGNLYAVDAAQGTERWTKRISQERVWTKPAVQDGVVYVGADDHRLHARRASDGSEFPSFPTGAGLRSSPVVADGVVYVGSGDGYLYAVSAGNVGRWRLRVSGYVWSSPAVGDGTVFVGSDDKHVYAVWA